MRAPASTFAALASAVLSAAACPGVAAWASDDVEVPEPAEVCLSCHSLSPDEPVLEGPTLWQVVGRPVASVPGFDYSDGLARLRPGRWDRDALDRFLAAPQAYAPGTAMTMGGVRSAAARAQVLDFLATLRPGADDREERDE